MKKLIGLALIAIVLLSAVPSYAGYVNGYVRRDGTYVQGHYRDTSNDGEPTNNVNYYKRSNSRSIFDSVE